MRLLSLLVSITLLSALLPPPKAAAQAATEPSSAPLDLSALNRGQSTHNNARNNAIVTANDIRQDRVSEPSLWWAKEQAENKLLDNWIAYKAKGNEPARVDLIVNQQIWSLLDYLDRYDFVNKLGTTASDYKYNIRVFNYDKEQLASYTCNFQASPKPQCNIKVQTRSRVGVQKLPQPVQPPPPIQP